MKANHFWFMHLALEALRRWSRTKDETQAWRTGTRDSKSDCTFLQFVGERVYNLVCFLQSRLHHLNSMVWFVGPQVTPENPFYEFHDFEVI